MKKTAIILSVIVALVLVSSQTFAFGLKCKGQLVLLEGPYYLKWSPPNVNDVLEHVISTACIRNLDLNSDITVHYIRYYSPELEGEGGYREVVGETALGPLEKIQFTTSPATLAYPPNIYPGPVADMYFLFEWSSDKAITPPRIDGQIRSMLFIDEVQKTMDTRSSQPSTIEAYYW